MQTWVMEELTQSSLGDVRLDERFRLVLDRLSQQPTLSIPAACRGWDETQAAYRFFDNDKVLPDKLLAPHRAATLERIVAEKVVLVAQDTTEVTLLRKQEKVGGPLKDDAQYGILVHPLWALTPERIPLGVLGAEIWARDPETFHQRCERRHKPIEDKESYRWLAGYRQACAVAEQAPATQVVCLSDSEGDIYECFAEALTGGGRKADWIVRACQDRCLREPSDDKVLSAVSATPILQEMTVSVSAREAPPGGDTTNRRRQARPARTALVSVRATQVTLKAPERRAGARVAGQRLPEVRVQVVLAREEKPPHGEEPITWLLLTSLPIDSAEAVQRVIAYYCCRWEIEVFFRVLKSGCRVEQLQLETTARMVACLAVYLIVAWRVLFLLRMGRECPELSCEAVLQPEEWQAVYMVVKRKAPPTKPPTLGAMLALIAGLGGYLNRKHDSPPGPKAMWIGMQRMRDFALAWTAFHPLRVARDV